MRIFFKRSFVSGREISGERGPSPSPCFGAHGAGSTGLSMRSGIVEIYEKSVLPQPERPARAELASRLRRCQASDRMKFLLATAALILGIVTSPGQTPESSPAPASMESLNKKVDEINAKLDALSQQLLKLEQQARPGVLIGESSPAALPTVATATGSASPASVANGNSHVVAKGETLTSIAKQTRVSVEDLQKFNHIEDGRKLQAGQTILIPATAAAAPVISPTASPSASMP